MSRIDDNTSLTHFEECAEPLLSTSVARTLLPLVLLAVIGSPSTAHAWIFDQDCASESTNTDLDQIQLPKALIMLDNSGSMGNTDDDDTTRQTEARNAIDDVVSTMTRSGSCDSLSDPDCDKIQFGLALFRGSQSCISDGTCRVTDPIAEDNLSPMLSTIDNNSPTGGTPIGEAAEVMRTAPSLDDTSRNSNGILITDGNPDVYDDTTYDNPTKAVEELCQLQNRNSSPADTYVLGFSSGTNTTYNNLLAAAGGTGQCCPSGQPNCSEADRIDPCQATDSELESYVQAAVDGTSDALACSGSFQADNPTALENAIYSIAEEIACTFPLSFPSDSYDSNQAFSDTEATSIQMSHKTFGTIEVPHESKDTLDDELVSKGVDSTTASQYEGEGWRFKNTSERQEIVLSQKLCGDILSREVETVTTQLACDCPRTDANESCTTTDDGRTGICTEGQYTCDIPPGDDVCTPIYGLDERTERSCTVSSNQGRCAVGVKKCSSGEETCVQDTRALPEICNGLDDDCNGRVDDINASWDRESTSLTPSDSSRTCGGVSACVCGSGDADTQHRGDGSTLEEEFQNMVSDTQTGCRCSE